jgi:hypothetical protein
LMHTLSAEQEDDARARVEKFLQDQSGSNEELAILGLQYLRGNRLAKRRGRREPA